MKKRSGGALFTVFAVLFAVILIAPFLIYAVLLMGWPPVIGNLTAAQAMRTYAAGAHPNWEAKSMWAGYNLVDNKYYLDFTYGKLKYDAGDAGGLVRDEDREDALQGELAIRSEIRKANEEKGHDIRWYAGWKPREPETPYISFRLDYYDPSGGPVPEEAAMREIMAEEALAVYEHFAPLTPMDRFSVYYCHEGESRQNKGNIWYAVTVDLPEGTALTREQILSAPIKVT